MQYGGRKTPANQVNQIRPFDQRNLPPLSSFTSQFKKLPQCWYYMKHEKSKKISLDGLYEDMNKHMSYKSRLNLDT